jgi:hypothetical protein
MTNLLKVAVVPVVVAALGAVGWRVWVDEGPEPFADEIVAARATWEAAGVDDYEVHVELHCYCDPSEVTVTVEDGEVTSVVDRDGVAVLRPYRFDDFTVDGWLDQAAEASADHDLDAFEVDPVLGAPTLIEHPAEDGVDDSGATYVIRVTV